MLQADDLSQSNDIKQKILDYFHLYFGNYVLSTELKLSELGFESIDYIQLAAYLLKTTNRWLDISKINKNMTISDINSYLLTLEGPKPNLSHNVKLDELQKHAYAAQFNGEQCNRVTYVIHYLQLQDHVELPRLLDAIVATINNHFILQCKITQLNDECYLVASEPQNEFLLKSPLLSRHFFSKKDIKKLTLTVYSDRLAGIYLQKKKNKYYLIINFHHIILDGWGHKIIQEEIFRRYAGLPVKQRNFINERAALNNIYTTSMNQPSVMEELKAIYKTMDLNEYNNLDFLFKEQSVLKHSCLVISKDELNHYAKKNNIEGLSYSTIFTFMMYQMIRQVSGKSKLLLFITLSNRFLPIPGIIELAGNAAIGLPLFLDKEKHTWQDLGQHIDERLRLYFKHMSYGAIVRLLLEGDTLLNQYIAPFGLAYYLLLTFTNNISKAIYNEDPVASNYVHWNNSRSYLDYPNKLLFCDVHDMGPDCFLHVHSRMTEGVHDLLFTHFMAENFPDAIAKMSN